MTAWRPRLALLAVLALTAAMYAPAVEYSFVTWDDPMHVLANPAVVGGGQARDVWLTPALGYPIPVTVASYRLEYAVWGADPAGYHATNVALHLVAIFLVAALARALGTGVFGATVAAALFALHPVAAEPVSWVSGRKDLLATVFGLAATLVFVRTRGRGSGVAATSLLALALFAKPSVGGLALLWAWFSWRTTPPDASGRRVSSLLRRIAPALAVTALAAALGFLGQTEVGAVPASSGLLDLVRNAHYALGYHLGLLFGLHPSLPKHLPATMPPAFEAVVDLAPFGFALLLFALARWMRGASEPMRRVWAAGLVFAGAAYLPVAGFPPLVRFIAESYLYLPLVGLALATGALVEAALGKVIDPRRRAAIFGLLAVAFTASAFSARAASAKWRNGVTLWTDAMERYPDSPQVCRSWANGFMELGRAQDAVPAYRLCIRRFGPDLFAKNLGVALYRMGQPAEARRVFEELAKVRPGDPVVRKYLDLTGPSASASP